MDKLEIDLQEDNFIDTGAYNEDLIELEAQRKDRERQEEDVAE